MNKCRYQIADDCHNWTDEGLTRGTSKASLGPPGPDGFRTLIDVPNPICPPCNAHDLWNYCERGPCCLRGGHPGRCSM